ncbi:MAG: alpha-1,2-fucosyltransferase [Desulfomonilaceae bacterium]|jgi:hypothetical protein
MVIVRLIGGLGNQMFQYATARAIAYRNRSTLKLDISFFKNDPKRFYALSHFNIIEEFASAEEIASFRGSIMKKTCGRVFRFIPSLRPTRLRSIALERRQSFDPTVLKLPGNIYLVGYWCSEKYFKDIEPVIRREFKVKTPAHHENEALAREIFFQQSVSLHIRRGDYVSDPTTYNFHGLCPISYYLEAANRIAREIDDPHFYVFSDDKEWIQQYLKLDWRCTYVTHNGPDQDYEDLRLISQCRHHIIANSTFSWWGAWLSDYPNKIVFSPKKWFRSMAIDTNSIVPPNWRQI